MRREGYAARELAVATYLNVVAITHQAVEYVEVQWICILAGIDRVALAAPKSVVILTDKVQIWNFSLYCYFACFRCVSQ